MAAIRLPWQSLCQKFASADADNLTVDLHFGPNRAVLLVQDNYRALQLSMACCTLQYDYM